MYVNKLQTLVVFCYLFLDLRFLGLQNYVACLILLFTGQLEKKNDLDLRPADLHTTGFRKQDYIFLGLIAKMLRPLIQVILPLMFDINPLVPNASFLHPRKHQKALRFSDISWWQKKVAQGTNGLMKEIPISSQQYKKRLYDFFYCKFLAFHQVPLTSFVFCHEISRKMLRSNHPLCVA